MPSADSQRLTAQLETALVRELDQSFRLYNATFFKNKLRKATIELEDVAGRLGQYRHATCTIAIQRDLCLTKPWSVVLEVLKHEMVHQYVLDTLRIEDETAHGRAFREVCDSLGVDKAASGVPSASSDQPPEEARVLERVAKLLALAESPNLNEAEAAMSAAQRLMLKYNLESVRAGQRQSYVFRELGQPSGRVTESERILGAILHAHFFIEAIWVSVYCPMEERRKSVLEVSGTRENVEMAAYVHSFLTHAAESLWSSHKRERGITANKDRRTFLAGVMTGFHEKLKSERAAHQREGLVWVSDADLTGYYRKRHPHIQNVRYAGNARTEAHAHGRAAGKKLVLHKPVGSGPGGNTRLLSSKGSS